ncbi:MAG TPA: hypothetical protein DD979_12305 [Gammaproteobacteria bacterium]|jgi:hypothetical protein|nr:hypothetical protein [Gammaproteobacteria bacterium]
MAKLLFRLRNVPVPEAQAVRTLLDDNGFDWYETHAGNWGISMPALWIKDDTQWAAARACIDAYQQQLQTDVRAAHAEPPAAEEDATLVARFLRAPVRLVLALIGILVVLYFSVYPFMRLFQG